MIQYWWRIISEQIFPEIARALPGFSDTIAILAFVATILLGVIATALTLEQLWVSRNHSKRASDLEAKIYNIEERSHLEGLQLEINLEIGSLLKKFDTLQDWQLNEWSWDDDKTKRMQAAKIDINNAFDRATLELQLFHREVDQRQLAARDLANGAGNLQSLRYMREIHEVRSKGDRPENRAELAVLKRHIRDLEERLFAEKRRRSD
jgi:hypothetical protein